MTTPTDLARELAADYPEEPEDLRTLRQRLAAAAETEGILDIAYRTVDSPVGTLLLAATGVGLVRVAYAGEDHAAVLQSLADRISPRLLHAPSRLESTARELDEYFAGSRQRFEVPIDWQLTSGFRSTVLRQLTHVAYGHTLSYAEVARLARNPRAVRAVGAACATNPLPVVVPCHRVVRSDGELGGYLGGAEAKRTLLALEAAA